MVNLETSAMGVPKRVFITQDIKNTVCPTCNEKIVGEYELDGCIRYHSGWCYKQRNQD